MKIFRIILWSIVALMLLSILISLIATDGRLGVSMFSMPRDAKVVFDKKYEDNIENIDLKWLSGNVNIYESDDECIRIVQKSSENLGSDELVSVQITGNNMRIDEKTKPRIYFFSFRKFG